MLGQEQLINQLNNMAVSNVIPNFIILSGEEGSGRKTIAKHIASLLNAQVVWPEEEKTDIAYVRTIISLSRNQANKVVYMLPDIDRASLSVENALLKITEEPPRNAYFIMTLLDGREVANTIKSRAITLRLARYSQKTLKEYAKSIGMDITDDTIFTLANTPGKLLKLATENTFTTMHDFVAKVVDIIGKVSTANAYKIADKIAFKDGDTGMSLENFFTLFSMISLKRMREKDTGDWRMYGKYLAVTGNYEAKLSITGINKKSLFDMWITEIRDVYYRYN